MVFERFFDESGGMQFVIHSPFGSRINRAWGLALRKRFCRKFNFELQAAATDDNILLSLTAAHSFELADVQRYLHSANVRAVLIQALLDAPMFLTRWRWVAGTALALPRFRGGRKVPAYLARMHAEDPITQYRVSVFNFARTWDQFILISILTPPACRRAAKSPVEGTPDLDRPPALTLAAQAAPRAAAARPSTAREVSR